MGQYYLIVNVDKKEFLYPHEFNDGLKLLEFGSSTEGTLLALTVLLSDGCGRGGGDLRPNSYREGLKKYLEACEADREKMGLPDCEEDNSPLIGSWAGDRIVIAGDYADPENYLTKSEIKQFQEIYKMEQPDSEYMEENTNVYHVAQALYKDISKEILAVLIDAGEICPEAVEGMISWNKRRNERRQTQPETHT